MSRYDREPIEDEEMMYFVCVHDSRKESDKKVTILHYKEYDDAITQMRLLEDLELYAVSVTMICARNYADLQKKYPNFR